MNADSTVTVVVSVFDIPLIAATYHWYGNLVGAMTASRSNRTAKYAEAGLGRHVAYLIG